jgi:hypothetical protein
LQAIGGAMWVIGGAMWVISDDKQSTVARFS